MSTPLPRSIWMPGTTELPSCYHGTPIEMVEAMASEMHPGLDAQEAMDQLLRSILESRRLKIQIPEAPVRQRAACFVGALLVSGIARPMASA